MTAGIVAQNGPCESPSLRIPTAIAIRVDVLETRVLRGELETLLDGDHNG